MSGRRERAAGGRRGRASGSEGTPGRAGGTNPGATPTPGVVELSPEERSLLDAVPNWLPPVLFALLTIGVFREFIFSGAMLYGEDTLTLGYMARAFFADALREGVFPLWNPVILGGTPFLESLAGGDSLYPPSLFLLVVMETYRALGWKLVLHVFLAGCFMYLWLRTLEVTRAGALVGGVAFLLAPYMVTLVLPGHDGKIFVTALTPLLFASCEWTFRRRDFLPFASLGAVVALVILTTHFQMAYFLFGATGAYMVFRTVQEARRQEGWSMARGLRHFGIFVGFSIVGAGAAGIQLIPAVDYVTEHSRRTVTTLAAEQEAGVAFSSSWSLHPEEIVSLAVPEFIGNSRADAAWATDTYWGRNPFKLNHEYLGLVALLLASIAFVGRGGGSVRWFMAGLAGVTVLFSLGANTPVWRLFYEVVPGVSLFRAPSMIIFLTGFAVATLAGIGVDRGIALVRSGGERRVLQLLGGAGTLMAAGFILAAAGVLTSLWLAIFSPELSEAALQSLIRAEPFIVRGFLVASVLAFLVLGTFWAVAGGHLTGMVAAALLVLLVTVDQFRVNDPFIQTLDYQSFAAPDGNHAFLMERAASEPPFRVFSMVQGGQDVAPGMHGLDLAAGHHPNDLARYRELIGMEGSGIPENLALFHPNVLRILNIRYILWPEWQYGPLEGAEPLSQIAFADGSIFASVYPYPGLPRARVVGDPVVVSEQESLNLILGDHDLDYDPFTQTVLTESPLGPTGGPEVRGSVEWLERTPNRLVFDVEATGPAIVVVSENWMPGWEATVDGEPARVLRADYNLRAVEVPQGVHRVELRYRPAVVRAGAFVSLAGVLLLAGAALPGLLRPRTGGNRPGSSRAE
jgi:hypothetical protein